MVDLFDVAEVAAKVLSEAEHAFATYELCGKEPYSAVDIAAIIGEKKGIDVSAAVEDRVLWEKKVRAAGLADYAVETLLKMFNYYEDYDFIGNGMVLSWLLEREPTSFEDFVKRELPKE
jgi:predicted RecB family nuclease